MQYSLEHVMHVILDNTCPSNVLPDGSMMYEYDLHCKTIKVYADKENGVWTVSKIEMQ